MTQRRHATTLTELRTRIAVLERAAETGPETLPPLPFGIAAIDAVLPEDGLPRGCLHEMIGAGVRDRSATGFCAALLARLGVDGRPALWCLGRRSRSRGGLYGPGLATFGLDPEQLILARGGRDDEVLWAMEEGLRAPTLSAVVGEVDAIDLTASRRLQLAAEASGVTAILLRPAAGKGRPNAAVTRWRIAAAPSIAETGVGRPCWELELLRCRGGRPGRWRVEWHGPEQGFALPAEPTGTSARARTEPLSQSTLPFGTAPLILRPLTSSFETARRASSR